jgi:hypothetical protein
LNEDNQSKSSASKNNSALQGHGWGMVGALFYANIAPANQFIISKKNMKGAQGAMFYSVYGVEGCRLGGKTMLCMG